jgi:glycosyltransferase involved in cell wall biosynthesis
LYIIAPMIRTDILLDARMARNSGIGTYVRGLLSGFSNDQKKRLTLLGDPADLGAWGMPVIESHENIYGPGEQTFLAWRIRRARPALLHTPHYNMPLAAGAPAVITVHDLIHLLFPAFSRRPLARLYARAMMSAATRKARLILTDSDCTRRDLENFGVDPAKIRVIHLGVDACFKPPSPADRDAAAARWRLPEGYLLYVGNVRAVKNVPRLVEAYRRLKSRRPDAPPLVLAGRHQLSTEETRSLEAPGVMRLGEVPGSLLPALYAGAAAFVFPSLYEGFGLPPLEAMACGCPVVGSTGGSLPEILGDAALLPDPTDADAISHALEKVLEDTALQEKMRRKGFERAARFTWSEAARRTWAAYQEIL